MDLLATLAGPADRAFNVLFALQVEALTGALTTRWEVAGLLLDGIPDPSTAEGGGAPTIDTWGMSREAQDGMAAFMALG